MGNCLGSFAGIQSYARVSNSYDFEIEDLHNSINVKIETLEMRIKHLELKYNGALNKVRDEMRIIENDLKGLETNFEIRTATLEMEFTSLNDGLQDNKTKTLSIKRKFKDLGDMINSTMNSSGDSLSSGTFPTEPENSESGTVLERPNLIPNSFEISSNSAFKHFETDSSSILS